MHVVPWLTLDYALSYCIALVPTKLPLLRLCVYTLASALYAGCPYSPSFYPLSPHMIGSAPSPSLPHQQTLLCVLNPARYSLWNTILLFKCNVVVLWVHQV